MAIIPANEIKMKYSRETIINMFCDNLMDRIKEKANKGEHCVVFDERVYHYKPTEEIFSNIQRGWKPEDWDCYKYSFCDYEDEIEKRFKQAGYTIKHTGYIGEILQKTKDIYW